MKVGLSSQAYLQGQGTALNTKAGDQLEWGQWNYAAGIRNQ